MMNSTFPFLVSEKAYACLTVVCLRVLHRVATLEGGEMFLSSSNFFDPYHYQVSFQVFSISTSSNYCTCSFISNVLTLYVAIFSRAPFGWLLFMTQRFIATLYVVVAAPNHILRHIYWRLDLLNLQGWCS